MRTTKVWSLRSASRPYKFGTLGDRFYPVMASSQCHLPQLVTRSTFKGKQFRNSPNMSKVPIAKAARTAKPRKPPPTLLESTQARLDVLMVTITYYDSRTELTTKQTRKREKHIQEKVNLELRLLELIESNNSVQGMSELKISAMEELNQDPETPARRRQTKPQVPASPALSENARLAPEVKAEFQEIELRQSKLRHNDLGLPKFPQFDTRYPKNGAFVATEPINAVSNSWCPQANVLSNVPAPVLPRSAVNKDTAMKHPTYLSWVRDKIVPPSAASGGVPDPSASYLSFCNMTPRVASVPQHLLLVIDLNGTLLYRPSRGSPHKFIERPSAQQFLNYVLTHFSVMIWSSARSENVDRMCAKLFPGDRRQLLIAEWTREHLGLSPEDFKMRVQVYKRMESIWNNRDIQARHPQAYDGHGWHQGNTVLIDDSVEKSRSEPHNFVEVTEFTGAPENPNILKDLAEYLATLRMHANVSSYIRQYPFKAPIPVPSASYNLKLQSGIS